MTRTLGCLLFLLLPFSVLAQTPPMNTNSNQAFCGGTHNVGDVITCYVTFSSDTAFRDVQVSFNLPSVPDPRHHGTYIGFVLRETRQVSPRTYAVTGSVADCVPGTYVLVSVIATTRAGAWQQYMDLGSISIVIADDSPGLPPVPQPSPTTPTADIPRIIQTPPPDSTLFPEVLSFRPAVKTPPPQDVVQFFSRLFGRRSDSCSGHHNQEDILRCRIYFAGNPRFRTVALSFHSAPSNSASANKSQQCLGFTAGSATQPAAPEPDGSYEVSRNIPKCRAGTYSLVSVVAFASLPGDPTNVYVHEYFNGRDFNSRLKLQLKDNFRHTFPAILSVTPTPPRR